MSVEPNAVELTVDQAWFIAETIGAGNFPWVLAITTPYRDAAQRDAFLQSQKDELTQMGLVSDDGVINPAVADWIRVVCFPDRWLDLRYVGSAAATGTGELLRGVVAQRVGTAGKPAKTIVALRSAQLITFTAMDIDDSLATGPGFGRRAGASAAGAVRRVQPCRPASESAPTNGCDPAHR